MDSKKLDYIYNKDVHYMRKGKWRNCVLMIAIVRRCQDKLYAIIKEASEAIISFTLFGYECNSGLVSLIGCSDIHQIKFESLELVPQFKALLGKVIKDVSFKIQLGSCTCPQSVLIVNNWYNLHVQTNRICLTTESGTQLVAKWVRSNIGDCYIEDSSLNVEIISHKDKCLYSFNRDEQFALIKLLKAIKNLKFESPLTKLEKFPLTPRRSGSVDLRRQNLFGGHRDRRVRDRTYSSSRVDDTTSNDDSSPPSTPCSPLCTFGTNEPSLSLNNNHIDEKDEELDDLMFSIDSTDIQQVNHYNTAKRNENSESSGELDDSQIYSNGFGNVKLVELERFPYESDLKIQGKLSPELNTQIINSHQTTYSYCTNINERLKNSSHYHTMESLQHHRKTSSDANFSQHQIEMDKKVNISHSVDLNCNHFNNFKISSSDKVSNSSSPLPPMSSGNQSSDNQETFKLKVPEESNSHYLNGIQQRLSPIMTHELDIYNEYYNMKPSNNTSDHPALKRYYSLNDDSQYYNLTPALLPNNQNTFEFPPVQQELSELGKNSTISYVELDFQDNFSSAALPRKLSPQVNYSEIGIYETEILSQLDNTIRGSSGKKKKPSFFKSIFKK